MAFGMQRPVFGVAVGLFSLAVVMLAVPQPAAAGFFERIFNGLRQTVDAPPAPAAPLAFIDPITSLANHLGAPQRGQQRAGLGGPSRAFCVRTCDGRFFPVQAHAGMSAAESCHAFCPASETRLYAGSNIDYATTNDGSRYANLPNAFAYRKQLVAGCTCNGRNAFGLAHIQVNDDPTLRQGDIVVTKTGLVAFSGSKNNVAGFTPVKDYSRLSKSTREKLADVKIMPPMPAAPNATLAIPSAAAQARAEALLPQAAR